MTALLGGAFDPPHNGHVALARAAQDLFGDVRVLVSAEPGHKQVSATPNLRLRLAQAAFPGISVELDDHPRTVDLLAEGTYEEPVFVIGADEFADFLTWKDPARVLELAELAVATRPGYPQERLDRVLAQLEQPQRVRFFEIEPLPISSRELRERIARGEDVSKLVPAGVAALIDELGLYRQA